MSESSNLQELFDDGIYAFSQNDFAKAIQLFEQVLKEDPDNFDALTSLSMAYYRMEDFPKAIEIGHLAGKLKPDEQAVHTNLSLFYMRNGEKEKAEHHGLQARIAGWKSSPDSQSPASPASPQPGQDSLDMAQPKPENIKIPPKFPDMPWKNK